MIEENFVEQAYFFSPQIYHPFSFSSTKRDNRNINRNFKGEGKSNSLEDFESLETLSNRPADPWGSLEFN